MQWTHPHWEDDQDSIFLHVEWGSTGAGLTGQCIMFGNGDTPFFSDRRLEISPANTVNRDLTGYRVNPCENHASIFTSIACGILEQDVPARVLGTFPTQAFPPLQVKAYGVADAIVNFTGNVPAYTPVLPDDANVGELRNWVSPADDAEQFRICGYITKDWAGGAAAGTVKIFVRCLG